MRHDRGSRGTLRGTSLWNCTTAHPPAEGVSADTHRGGRGRKGTDHGKCGDLPSSGPPPSGLLIDPGRVPHPRDPALRSKCLPGPVRERFPVIRGTQPTAGLRRGLRAPLPAPDTPRHQGGPRDDSHLAHPYALSRHGRVLACTAVRITHCNARSAEDEDSVGRMRETALTMAD